VLADLNASVERPKYLVIRDDREKTGKGWHFPPSETCGGTVIGRLATGDYTIQSLESTVALERKASAAELSRNFFAGSELFRAELERLQQLEFAAVVCEFPIDHILEFPRRCLQISDRPHPRIPPPRAAEPGHQEPTSD